MRYHSTRGEAPVLSFSDVLLAGLASDGGLYVPETWPQISKDRIKAFAGMAYADVAVEVLTPFVEGDIPADVFKAMCHDAYAGFAHEAVTPLTQYAPDNWVMELYHGPTLAFKDVALQLLGRLFEYVLGERGEKLTIVGATSGDTGGAAIEALKGRDAVDVFILHPKGRISDVQRRMMTCVDDQNIHNIALEGSFDDCQAMVKAMFADHDFRDGVRLGAINSINWARIMAQVVYYFTTASSLGAPERDVSYCVPTGNFGDIFAGYVAAQMGLPIQMLCVATNQNDILDRTLRAGAYKPLGVAPTISPSMDIQVSSNFERLIYDISGDAEMVRGLMGSLKQAGEFTLPEPVRAKIAKRFLSARADEAETSEMIKRTHVETGHVVDPHTAVGLVAAEKLRAEGKLSGPVVTLATAHAAKFPDAVEAACGVHPTLPAHLSDLFERQERMIDMPDDRLKVQTYVREKARI